jgi:ABC-2 type transport system ATP-binding protein
VEAAGDEVLSFVDLEKRFGDVVALDGLGFDVHPGRILGFLGPNGAGKTTAMRCVFGLVRPDSGEVRWRDLPVDAVDRLQFGYMPEERGLYPKMRVGEQLAYFARLSGRSTAEASDAATAWMDRLGLLDRAASRVEELSHGNQQRVQLAVSLVHDPTVAILDEPFSGLDPIGMETMAAVLRNLADQGVAIMFSSHQLDLVEDVCQDVVIINRGRVVLSGEVGSLRNQAPFRHLTIEVDGVPWTSTSATLETVESNGRRIYLVDRATPLETIMAEARSAGEITKFSFEPPGLSDLFRQAVAS